jgi:sporulation protein YlmC with PRC-barrel domain
MRKLHISLPIIVVFCLLAAACSSSPSANSTPGAYPNPQTPGEATSTTGGIPSTGGQNGTSTITGTAVIPTQPITLSSPVPSMVPTQTLTSTQGVPSTGASSQGADPGLVSNELQFQLVDKQNKPLGQVKDIILDLDNLKVAYVVVGITQTTGTAEKQIPLPWDEVGIQTASSTATSTSGTPAATAQAGSTQGSSVQGAFIYQGDPQLLANAPEFSADSLPQLGQPAGTWDASILSYWSAGGTSSAVGTSTVMTPTVSASSSATGTPSASSGTPASGQPSSAAGLQGVALASKVVGITIMDANNQEVAKVSDAVVDIESGSITYVILDANNKLIPVPPQDLGMDMQNQSVVLQSGAPALQGAPSFDKGSFPLTTSTDWDAQIKSYWQSQMQPTMQSTSQPSATP